MEAPPAAIGPPAERSSPLAWIALTLAFVWVLPLGLLLGLVDTVLDVMCTLAGAVLAVIVLLRSRHGTDRGRLLAWIALAGVATKLVFTLALSLIARVIFEGMDPEFTETGLPLPPDQLVSGDCLLSDVEPVLTSCEEPHRAEVTGTYTLPELGWFEDPETAADPLCNSAVADYLGISEDEAAWRYGFSISGDEPYEVACWAVSEDSVTGTMRVPRP